MSKEKQPAVENSTKEYVLVKPLVVRGELRNPEEKVELTPHQAKFARAQGCIA